MLGRGAGDGATGCDVAHRFDRRRRQRDYAEHPGSQVHAGNPARFVRQRTMHGDDAKRWVREVTA